MLYIHVCGFTLCISNISFTPCCVEPYFYEKRKCWPVTSNKHNAASTTTGVYDIDKTHINTWRATSKVSTFKMLIHRTTHETKTANHCYHFIKNVLDSMHYQSQHLIMHIRSRIKTQLSTLTFYRNFQVIEYGIVIAFQKTLCHLDIFSIPRCSGLSCSRYPQLS